MKIYDISQEVFGCAVYPGDPAPERRVLSSMMDGALYNLSAFSMCAHNGTHIDAPAHFLQDGKTIEGLDLAQTVGTAFVTFHTGEVSEGDAREILSRARTHDPESVKRILIGGQAIVTEAAARVFAGEGVLLLGNESQTVGPEDGPMAVHLILLSAGMVLLEGIRLSGVPEGCYLLSAAPLALSEADGAPCRAVLIKL